MIISSLSVPKDRALHVPNDDTVLILPGLLAVFDGATSPQPGGTLNSSGRIASQAAARAVAQLAGAQDLMTLPPATIFAAIADNIRADSARFQMAGKPSTTMALAVLGQDQLRLLLIGDSSIRINGDRLLNRNKPIDDISTQNRLAVHAMLAPRHDSLDEREKLTRSVMFDGYTEAISRAILTEAEAQSLRDDLAARFAGLVDRPSLTEFLNAGIRQQFRFANRADHPMGFSTLNGDPTLMADITDEYLPRSSVRSLEIFSDGYFLIPDAVGIDAWESAYLQAEAEDFHKLHRFANVKGATSSEFADDRSLIVALMAGI